MDNPVIQGAAAPGAAPPADRDLLDFLKTHIHAVAIAGGLAILVAVIAVAYLTQQRRNSETASQMLGVAQTSKQLEELLAQYPSSSSAPIALLALAANQYAAGAYDQALIFYMRFLQQYPKHHMAPAAELGKALCFEGRGEGEQALAAFTAFQAAHPDHFLQPQALMGKARCLQQLNRPAEARAVYEDFIAANPKSDWKSQMEMALRYLERAEREPQAAAVPFVMPNPGATPSAAPLSAAGPLKTSR